MKVIPIIDQSNTRSANVEECKPILNRCAPEIMQRDVVDDRYRIGIKKKNVENLSAALKANLRRRKAERKNEDAEKDKAYDNIVNTKKIT